MLTTKEWDVFFDLMERIVDSDGSLADKESAVLSAAHERGESAEMNLQEFVSWGFDE